MQFYFGRDACHHRGGIVRLGSGRAGAESLGRDFETESEHRDLEWPSARYVSLRDSDDLLYQANRFAPYTVKSPGQSWSKRDWSLGTGLFSHDTAAGRNPTNSSLSLIPSYLSKWMAIPSFCRATSRSRASCLIRRMRVARK